MASQAEIAATYDYLDEFWRATFGETPDIAGRQEMIYRDFFRLCTDLLPPSGRLF